MPTLPGQHVCTVRQPLQTAWRVQALLLGGPEYDDLEHRGPRRRHRVLLAGRPLTVSPMHDATSPSGPAEVVRKPPPTHALPSVADAQPPSVLMINTEQQRTQWPAGRQ